MGEITIRQPRGERCELLRLKLFTILLAEKEKVL